MLRGYIAMFFQLRAGVGNVYAELQVLDHSLKVEVAFLAVFQPYDGMSFCLCPSKIRSGKQKDRHASQYQTGKRASSYTKPLEPEFPAAAIERRYLFECIQFHESLRKKNLRDENLRAYVQAARQAVPLAWEQKNLSLEETMPTCFP